MPRTPLTKILVNLNLLASLYVVFWCCNVILSTSTEGRNLAIMACIVWLFTLMLLHPGYLLKPNLARWLCIFWLLYITAYSIVAEHSELIRQLFSTYILFLLYIIVDYCKQYNPNRLLTLFWVAVASLSIFSVTTLIGYGHTPNASRLLSHSFDGDEFYYSQGIGGYVFIYAVTACIPTLLFILRNRISSSRIARTLITVGLALLIIVCVTSGYFLALLIMVFSCAIVLVYKAVTKLNFVVMLAILGTVVFVVPASSYVDLLDQMSESFGNRYVATKFSDLSYSLANNEIIGTVNTRFKIYESDFTAILSNPLEGDISQSFSHSQIMGITRVYGAISGLIYVAVSIRFILNCCQSAPKANSAAMNVLKLAMVLVFVFMALFDTMPYSAGIPFFLLPATASLLYNPKPEEQPALVTDLRLQ